MGGLFVDHAVGKFGELGGVPPVSGTHEVAGYALQAVDAAAVASRTFVEPFGGVLVAAVEATVAVMVHGAVADVVAVHKVDNVADGLGVVSGVAVDLDIEDMAAASELMVGAFYARLVGGGAVVVDRHVVGIGVVSAVGDAGDGAEALAVAGGELAGKPFGRGGEHGEVVAVALGEFVGARTHVADDAESQGLRLFALAMVLAGKGDEALGQTDEPDAEGPLIDDRLYGLVGAQVLGAKPQARHQQGELFGQGRALKVVAVAELAGGNLQKIIKAVEERGDALFAILDAHALYGQTYDVDCGEGEVATAYGCFHAVAVLEHAGSASHGCHFVEVALRVVLAP